MASEKNELHHLVDNQIDIDCEERAGGNESDDDFQCESKKGRFEDDTIIMGEELAFDESYTFKERPIEEFQPIHYRKKLNSYIFNDNETSRENFYTGEKGRLMKYPHPFENQRWMVSIEPETKEVDFSLDFTTKKSKVHAIVFSNNARKMIFHPWGYDDHHNSPKYVEQYNQYIIGMIYKYRTLMEALLQYPKEGVFLPFEGQNQFNFVMNRLDAIAGAVYDFKKGPIGKYNSQYMRSTIDWIESKEDANFVLAMANCDRYEIVSKYICSNKPYSKGYWVFHTKIYYPQINGTEEVETFAFGWNHTQYILRINVDRCLDYKKYFVMFWEDFNRRQQRNIKQKK